MLNLQNIALRELSSYNSYVIVEVTMYMPIDSTKKLTKKPDLSKPTHSTLMEQAENAIQKHYNSRYINSTQINKVIDFEIGDNIFKAKLEYQVNLKLENTINCENNLGNNNNKMGLSFSESTINVERRTINGSINLQWFPSYTNPLGRVLEEELKKKFGDRYLEGIVVKTKVHGEKVNFEFVYQVKKNYE